MQESLRREIRILRATTAACVVCTIVLVVTAFQASPRGKQRFEEIDVERLNVIEKDGRIRLILGNRQTTPGPIERGVPFGYPAGTRAGLIFYNDEGTENGGLIFEGRRDSAGKYNAVGSLTFDQYEQDQTIALQYVDENGRRRAGLAINDYALGMTSRTLDRRYKAAQAIKDSAVRADSMNVLRPYFLKQRMYVGRGRDGAALVTLADAAGRTRLRLRVDSIGAAAIEFLNDSGRVVQRIPESR